MIIVLLIAIAILAACTRAQCEEMGGSLYGVDCSTYPEIEPTFTPIPEILPTPVPHNNPPQSQESTEPVEIPSILDIFTPTPGIFFSPLPTPTATPYGG